MADLHHLMDELNRPEEEEGVTHSVTEEDENIHDGELPHDEHAIDEVPPILKEAASSRPVDKEPDRLDLQDLIRPWNEEDEATKNQRIAYGQIKSWWIHESQAPELLPWQNDLMESWIQTLNDIEEEEDNDVIDCEESGQLIQFRALLQSIRRIDRQHLQYILSNLLSTRLLKIQKYHMWLTLEWDNPETQVRLGPAEKQFLQDFHSLWTEHIEKTVTDHFPQSVWKKLDEPEMVQSPNLDEFCWVRVLQDITLHLSQSQSSQYDDDVDAHRYNKGSVLVIPYSRVRDLIQEQKVELFI